MSAKSGSKSKGKKPLETTLGKAPVVPKDTIDVAHLRKPIDTSVAGVNEILKLYETATDEVQRYITYECDILYECRTCRTIFRSLANLILHKRDYCRELYYAKCKSSVQENDETELEAILTKEPSSLESTSSPQNCDVNKSSPSLLQSLFLSTNESDGNKKDLDSVLSFLQNKQSNSLITEQYLNEDISEEMSSISDIASSNNLPFQRTVDSRFISLQTMFENVTSNSNSENGVTGNMKEEVREIRNMLENNEAVLDSDGKIIEAKSTKDSNFHCNVCNHKFVTEKTLTFHIKYKHNSSKLIYKCPLCSNTFANTWGVFRHLYKLHNKTRAQVKKMRSQIHYNVLRRDEIPQVEDCVSKEDTTKLEILKQWMNNVEDQDQRCGGCWRRFERKAALNAHVKGCSKRTLACNSVKEIKREEKKTVDEKQTKGTKTNKCMGSQRRKATIVSKVVNVVQECTSKISEKLQAEIDEQHCIIKSFSKKASFKMVNVDDSKNPFCGFDNSIIKSEPNEILDDDKGDNCSDKSVNMFRGFSSEPIEISSDSSVDSIVSRLEDLKEETTDDLLTEKCTRDSGYDPSSCEVIISDGSDNSSHEVEAISNTERFEKENFELSRKRSRSPDILENHKKFKSDDKDESHMLTLEMKSLNYIDKEMRYCIPCKKEFKSNGCLMKHMANHFKWYRFICTMCDYKAYSRSKCEYHVELKHHKQDNTKAFIKRLTIVQTLEFCSDSIIIKNKGKVEEPIKCETPVKSPGENHNDSTVFSMLDIGHSFLNSISSESKEASPDDGKLKDASLKNMIIGVILGFDNSQEESVCNNITSNLEESESTVQQLTSSTSNIEASQDRLSEIEESLESFDDANCLKSRGCIETVPIFQDTLRPIRNRVQPIQKDFVYDLLKPNIVKDTSVSNKEMTVQKKGKNLKTYFNRKKRGAKLFETSESFDVVPNLNLTNDIVVNTNNSNLVLPEHVTGD